MPDQEDKRMAVVEQLLRSEADGSISFGNHALAHKAKLLLQLLQELHKLYQIT